MAVSSVISSGTRNGQFRAVFGNCRMLLVDLINRVRWDRLGVAPRHFTRCFSYVVQGAATVLTNTQRTSPTMKILCRCVTRWGTARSGLSCFIAGNSRASDSILLL